MVSTATKRRRQQKANRTATAIENAIREQQHEKKTVGMVVTSKSKDADLFSIDRSGVSKQALREKHALDAKSQRKEAKKLRRIRVKPRKSEMHAIASDEMEGVSYSEKQRLKQASKQQEEGSKVEKTLLKRMKNSHVRNLNKPRVSLIPGKEDLDLLSETKKQMENMDDKEAIIKKETLDDKDNILRQKMVKKMAKQQQRKATGNDATTGVKNAASGTAILLPNHGVSINPSFEHHQDKLGEALSDIISRKDKTQWAEDKMKYDEAMVNDDETGKKVENLTGMNVDSRPLAHTTGGLHPDGDEKAVDANGEDEDDDEDLGMRKAVPERKTRSERNKEKRKREIESNIRKKQRVNKMKSEYLKFDQIVNDVNEKEEVLKFRQDERAKKKMQDDQEADRPVIEKIAGRGVRTEAHNQTFALSNELASSWRSVQPAKTSALLKDRQLSFERRGLVEPPTVIPREVRRMAQEKRQEERKDKTKRRGKHSTSNISYWKEKSRKR